MECSALALSGLLLGQRVSNSLLRSVSEHTSSTERRGEERHSQRWSTTWLGSNAATHVLCVPFWSDTRRNLVTPIKCLNIKWPSSISGPNDHVHVVWMLEVTIIYRLLLHLHCQSYWYLTVILCQRLRWSNCSLLNIYFHMHKAKLNFTFFLSKKSL